MSLDPLVSVVVPSFNTPEPFLRDCLESLRDQTVPAWEAIVVDDGSTRGDVASVVSRLRDPRFRTIRHSENRERGPARNTGFRTARGQLFLPLDADDRLHPEYMEATVRAMEEHPDSDWVLTDFQLFGASDEVWRFPVPLPPLCPAHMPYVGGGVLLRRRVWETVGGYPEVEALTDGADLDFWLSAFELGYRPAHVARPLYLYRRHGGSSTSTDALYTSSIQCETIYRRHRVAFESLGADCPLCTTPNRGAAFRAHAYLTSSAASLQRGERLRAIRLALRGLSLQPRNRTISRQLARSLLPARVRKVLRRLARRQTPVRA